MIGAAKQNKMLRYFCKFAGKLIYDKRMINKSNYLPQYALNQLADRVAMKVDYISRLYKADRIWDNTIELCQEIEAEPRDVSTVIIEVSKDTGTAVSGTNIRWYHVRLTLVYILLYYRHQNHTSYKKIVFPQLIKNMGAYGDDKILKSKIQQEIENIKEEDKLLEQESTKLFSIPTVPSANDIAEGRIKFIRAINAGLVEIEAINWADATMGFDRAVMKELFWGVENDDLLRTIVQAIIKTWHRLAKEKDNRCLMNTPGAASLSMAASIDLWKFGGLTRETINKFFDDLWVERNAKNTYATFGLEKKPIEPASKKVVATTKTEEDKTETDNKNNETEQLREELTKVIAERDKLADELKAYMERNQNRRGINRLKTAHLGIKLAPKLGIEFTNKKALAPMLSKLFGWGQNSLEKQMSQFFSKEEELELANIFGELSPELAKYICADWEGTPPQEDEAPQTK